MHATTVMIQCVLFLTLSTGCATIVSGKRQDILLRSEPPEVTVYVWESAEAHKLPKPGQEITASDEEVATVLTPAVVSLARKLDYVVRFEKTGYVTVDEAVCRSTWGNKWALGNLGLLPLGLFPGLIGVFVDVGTGAQHQLVEPDLVELFSDPAGPDGESLSSDGEAPEETIARAVCHPDPSP